MLVKEVSDQVLVVELAEEAPAFVVVEDLAFVVVEDLAFVVGEAPVFVVEVPVAFVAEGDLAAFVAEGDLAAFVAVVEVSAVVVAEALPLLTCPLDLQAYLQALLAVGEEVAASAAEEVSVHSIVEVSAASAEVGKVWVGLEAEVEGVGALVQAQVEEPLRGQAWGTPPPREPPGTTGPPPAGHHRHCTTARPQPHTSGHRSPPAAPRLCTLPRQHQQRPPETQHMVRLLPLVKSKYNLSKCFMFPTKESEIFHQCYKKLWRRGRNVIKV